MLIKAINIFHCHHKNWVVTDSGVCLKRYLSISLSEYFFLFIVDVQIFNREQLLWPVDITLYRWDLGSSQVVKNETPVSWVDKVLFHRRLQTFREISCLSLLP